MYDARLIEGGVFVPGVHPRLVHVEGKRFILNVRLKPRLSGVQVPHCLDISGVCNRRRVRYAVLQAARDSRSGISAIHTPDEQLLIAEQLRAVGLHGDPQVLLQHQFLCQAEIFRIYSPPERLFPSRSGSNILIISGKPSAGSCRYTGG